MFSLVAPEALLPAIILQLRQCRAKWQLSVGIDTRQRDHDDVGRVRAQVGSRACVTSTTFVAWSLYGDQKEPYCRW